MPSVTYNGQSFAIDGKRLWILGASIQYARVPQAFWRSRISAARQAGFNTIETAAVWSLHEPRKGRFVFDEQADIRKFVEQCAAEGMKVVLRVGPFVGHDFDAGGIPGWLVDAPGATKSASHIALREANEIFLEHVSRYFRKLLGEVSDLQATSTGGGANGGAGPIILVQGEHAWTCSNQMQVEKYLHEITRIIRESGMNVPVINANDLWQDSPGTIDTWRGSEHLLYQLRQLRTVQPTAPRIVSEFAASRSDVWGGAAGSHHTSKKKDAAGREANDHSPQNVLERLAEVLAAGAQPIVAPFHGGTNFGFLGGQRPGEEGGFISTHAGGDAPLGEAGERGEKYAIIKRLITFANHFSGVFTELDPEYQPIAIDPHEARTGARSGGAASVVSLRGTQGRAIFVFGKPSDEPITLVLDNGLRLPIVLGDQSVTWTTVDADLQGAGRLEYCNICPWAVVDRSIVIFHGPAKAAVYLSIDNVPLESTVPAVGAKPTVVEHHGLTVVILNREQVDATYFNGQNVYVGIDGLDVHNHVIASAEAASKPWVISAGGRIEALTIAPERGAAKTKGRKKKTKAGAAGASADAGALPTIGDWQAFPATPHVEGTSPRFASLDGPATLSDCGAPTGYGWYRIKLHATGKHLVMLPHSNDRIHVFLDGASERIVGLGPGAKHGPFEIKFERADKGAHMIVALADNLGRASAGNDLSRKKGLFGHMYEVKAIRGKAKIVTAKPTNGFTLRGFIEGRAADQPGDVRQAVWTFAHPRKTPVIIDIDRAQASGTFVLNDKPVAYFAGSTGCGEDRIVLEPDSDKPLKRGRNVLRFVPDHGGGDAQEIADRTTLYDAKDNLTAKAEWSFAKWEPPPQAGKTDAKTLAANAEAKPVKGQPCWWRAMAEVDAATAASDHALYLDVASMSKGQAFVNGHNLGRYFSATAEGKAVGPQTRLYVPTPWLKAGANEVMIFDEHGYEPNKVRMTRG